MALILAKEIVSRASDLLQDVAQIRWRAVTLLGYLNDGQREIVLLKPDSGTRTRIVTLVAGTKQVLPDDGIKLSSVMRNIAADDGPGAVVTIVEREELDALDRRWHAATPAAEVEHYVFDGRNPTVYYTYPPAIAGSKLEIAYTANPVDCTIDGVPGPASDSTISLNDIYQTALVEYLLHRAYDGQTDGRDVRKAQDHYKLFQMRLGLKTQVDKAQDPNKNSPPAEVRRVQETPNSGPAY